MYSFLLTLLVLDAFVLIAAVLLQSGKGGGLAANFGGSSSSSDSLMGTRQAGNLLTKASWWCGGIFLGLSLILQVMGSKTATPRSVLDNLAAPVTSPAPASPGTAAPALPLTAPSAKPPAEANPPAGTKPPVTPPAKPPAKP